MDESTPMPPTITPRDRSMTDRLLGAYAEAEIEPWLKDHLEANHCCACEEAMRWGVTLLKMLVDQEGRDQRASLKGSVPADEELEAYPALYRRLLGAFEMRLGQALKIKSLGYEVDDLDDFIEAIEELRAIVGNQEIAEGLAPLGERLSNLRTGNPDPEQLGN